MKNYIKLMRPKHYLKNALVFAPLFFDLNIGNRALLLKAVLGTIAFCLISSVVYIINDINDLEKDRNSDKKKLRPLAAGTVSIPAAVILACCLTIIVLIIEYTLKWIGIGWLVAYLVINIFYSFGMKNIPLIDVLILTAGFCLRLLYGANITNIDISFWICMTVISLSFYMGLGKRRGELINKGYDAHEVRGVLKYYNQDFLDKNMYMCLGLGIMFYALWSGAEETIDKLQSTSQMWTVPIIIVLAMRYSLDIEGSDLGDPMEVITHDKWLIILGAIYFVVMVYILYFV